MTRSVQSVIPSPTRGLLGTSHPGEGSLRSAYRQTLAGVGEPEYGQSLGDGMAERLEHGSPKSGVHIRPDRDSPAVRAECVPNIG